MSRVSVRVRPAEAADIAQLAELTRSVDHLAASLGGRVGEGNDDDLLARRFAELLEDATQTLLVAVDDTTGEIIGLLAAHPAEIGAIELTPVLHISHLVVAAKQRRRGAGRALLTAAVQAAEERGYDRVLATAAAGSRESNRYLARLGFAPMVIRRVASVGSLRRSLGIGAPERAVVRRARLVRVQRAGFGGRAARKGARANPSPLA